MESKGGFRVEYSKLTNLAVYGGVVGGKRNSLLSHKAPLLRGSRSNGSRGVQKREYERTSFREWKTARGTKLDLVERTATRGGFWERRAETLPLKKKSGWDNAQARRTMYGSWRIANEKN